MEKLAERTQIKTKRIDYIDIIRGFAMLCIIAGHMGNSLVIRIVFTFHVPVFFIISGLFFRNDIKKIKNTTIKLLKPYVFTVLCVAFLDGIKAVIRSEIETKAFSLGAGIDAFTRNIIAGLYGSGSKTNFLNFRLTAIGAIWFYLALIWSVFLCWVILNVAEKNLKSNRNRKMFWYAAALALWAFGYFTAKTIWLPTSVQAGCSAVIFMIMGISTREYEQRNGRWWEYCVAGLLWIISIYFSITNDFMSIVRSAFPDPIINIVGACSATWLLFNVGKRIENKKYVVWLKKFGKYSMVVLSFHLIELNIIPWDKIIRIPGEQVSWLNKTLIFGLKVVWCFLGVELCRRFAALRWIYSLKE